MTSDAFEILLIILQPVLLLLLSFILNSTISLLLNLLSTQTKRLQLVLNAAARDVTKTLKFHHISPILKSLHWLKIDEEIQYKVLSYKTLNSGHPSYLYSLLNIKAIVLHTHLLCSHLIILAIILASKSQIGHFILLLLCEQSSS
jgi:hypothetical protein